MSLTEYKSPVLKKPKFGWQRYQFGNKTAAELKTSLWDANLSEVILKNEGNVPTFPIAGFVDTALVHDTADNVSGRNQYIRDKMKLQKPINNINELVQYLNQRDPFLGEFRPTPDQKNVLLVVDKTWSRVTMDNDGGTWIFKLSIGL